MLCLLLEVCNCEKTKNLPLRLTLGCLLLPLPHDGDELIHIRRAAAHAAESPMSPIWESTEPPEVLVFLAGHGRGACHSC